MSVSTITPFSISASSRAYFRLMAGYSPSFLRLRLPSGAYSSTQDLRPVGMISMESPPPTDTEYLLSLALSPLIF